MGALGWLLEKEPQSMEVAWWLRVGATAASIGSLTLRGPWGQRMERSSRAPPPPLDGPHLGCPSPAAPQPQTRWAAVGPPRGSAALSTRPGRLGGQSPMVFWLYCSLLPAECLWHQDETRLGWEKGKLQEGYVGEEVGAGVWGSGVEVGGGSGPPHVDLLLCRFSTERTVA